MADMKHKYGWFYSSWYKLALWMVGIALLIGVIYTVFMGKDFTLANVLLPSLFNTLFLWGGSMSIVMYVWNKFPWERFPLRHIVVEVLLILTFLSLFVVGMNLYLCHARKLTFAAGLQQNMFDILFTVLITFLIVTIHEAIFFYRQWKLNFSKSIRLEKDNLEAQYNALKAQVNPHFLFNSLNSLMNLLEENPLAEKYVQDLSDYLRYVLLSNTRETVPLKEEMDNVEKYLNLQKQRFGDNFNVVESIQPDSLQKHLPPLALQMLLENCFSHNVVSKSKPLSIRIDTDSDSLTIKNNLQVKQSVDSTGQGLKNIEGRYRFVEGRGVKVIFDETSFSVTLPLISK
jgi:sensor histidine kinase YesM